MSQHRQARRETRSFVQGLDSRRWFWTREEILARAYNPAQATRDFDAALNGDADAISRLLIGLGPGEEAAKDAVRALSGDVDAMIRLQRDRWTVDARLSAV